jgi:hypothetical protein
MVPAQRSRGPINRPQDRKPGLRHKPGQHPKLGQLHSPNHKTAQRLKIVQLRSPNRKIVQQTRTDRHSNPGHRTLVAVVHKDSHKGSEEAANRTRARGTQLSMRAGDLL